MIVLAVTFWIHIYGLSYTVYDIAIDEACTLQ